VALNLVDLGENILLDAAFKNGTGDWTLKLYTAVSPSPSDTSIAGHFSVATFGSYVNKTLTRGNWTTASGGTTTYPTLSWTASSSQSLLGYFVIDGSGNLLWYEAFSTTLNVGSGVTFAVNVSFSLD
jgi:hypothetical protein